MRGYFANCRYLTFACWTANGAEWNLKWNLSRCCFCSCIPSKVSNWQMNKILRYSLRFRRFGKFSQTACLRTMVGVVFRRAVQWRTLARGEARAGRDPGVVAGGCAWGGEWSEVWGKAAGEGLHHHVERGVLNLGFRVGASSRECWRRLAYVNRTMILWASPTKRLEDSWYRERERCWVMTDIRKNVRKKMLRLNKRALHMHTWAGRPNLLFLNDHEDHISGG